MWCGSVGAIRSDSDPHRQELPEVPISYAGMDHGAPPLASVGAATASNKDAARLLPVLWATSLRAQAQLGTPAGTATVDTGLKSPRSAATDELDASEGPVVV